MLRCVVERRMQRINTLSLNDVYGYLKTVPVYVPQPTVCISGAFLPLN